MTGSCKRMMLAAAVALIGASCVPPRDSIAPVACTEDSQCPGGGLYYCDKAPGDGVCKLCAAGTCSSKTDVSTDTTDASDDATAVDIASAATLTCKNRCNTADKVIVGKEGCFCDVACKKNDDCCPDFDVLCPVPLPDAATMSCAVRKCGDYDPKLKCQCDPKCPVGGSGTAADRDCCADYDEVCLAGQDATGSDASGGDATGATDAGRTDTTAAD